MAKRPHRYTEARMYLVGGSVGLLLIVWSGLAMKDRTGSRDPERADPGGAAGCRFEQLVLRRLASETGGRKAERDCRTATDAKTADPLPGFVTMFQKATFRAMEYLDRVAGCAVPFRANVVENERADLEVVEACLPLPAGESPTPGSVGPTEVNSLLAVNSHW
jgi:hypothetical protein